jgi:beta-phosphoglucomutase-like phosphatase (HAD superfamily)
MLEAVIFDIDGTLVDSVDLHAKRGKWRLANSAKNFHYHVDLVRQA